jgi:hypothetical protein
LQPSQAVTPPKRHIPRATSWPIAPLRLMPERFRS